MSVAAAMAAAQVRSRWRVGGVSSVAGALGRHLACTLALGIPGGAASLAASQVIHMVIHERAL